MAEENTEVKQTTDAPKVDGGKTAEADAQPAPVEEADRLSELEVELAKVKKEKDDFFQGMNAWKKKAKSRIDDELSIGDEDLDERIERKVQENMIVLRERQLLEEKDKIIQQAIRENRELKAAIQNRSQVSSKPSGSSSEAPEVSKEFWSPEQLADLKKRGIDPQKVRENMERYKIK